MAVRNQATGPSMVPWVLVGTAVAAAAATWFGYPGLILLVLGIIVAAYMAPPALLTGKKDISGFPTAASPGESRAMNRYRMWGELKWRAITPNSDWLPGWPVRLWWVASLFLAVATLAIPSPELGNWWRIGNAFSVFITANALNGALRRWTAPDDLNPGPTLDVWLSDLRRSPRYIAAAAGAAVAAAVTFLGTVLAIDKLNVTLDIYPVLPWELGVALALAAAATIAALSARTTSLARWRTMIQVRADWLPRWQIAKLDPMPTLIDHTEVGSIQIDTFESHPTVGSAMVSQMTAKLAMGMGAATRLAFLESPALDGQGQPLEGSKHPLRFRIVTFNTDDMPDINNLDIDPAEAELVIAAAASWLSDAMGSGRWVLLNVEPLHVPPAEGGEGSTGAWVAHFAQPDGPDAKWLRENGVDEIGGAIGTESLVDNKANEVYFGGLTSGTTQFRDPGLEKRLADLALVDTWAGRWRNILKMGAVQPRPEHAVYAEAKLGTVTMYRQPFVVQQGMDPLEFFKLEPKIRTTLSAAPFVSVTGFSGAGDRPGERHGQAFCVTWAAEPVPSNPDKLTPQEGIGPRWVLSGRINEAFDASRLARPEIAEARPLTDRKSRGHIWEVKLRLYGGVTLANVRDNAQKIRQALGSKWLRVADAPDGCIIVAGVDPKDARGLVFARPEKRNADYVTSLDWEQAFSDAHVVGSGGILPKLVRTGTLPNNDQVSVLDFKLPTGTDRTMVKAAVPKLQTGTGNAFVEVRPSPDGADHVRILVSHEHPLPESAPVDWDAVDASEGPLYFATGVEGEPVGFDIRKEAHVLVAGASGGGKSVALQVLLYPALANGSEIYVIDPTKAGADFQFAAPYAKAFAASVDEAVAVMKAVYAEVVRRKDLNAQYGVGGYRDLPEEVRPKHIYLVMDEFTSLMQPDPVSKVASDDPEVEHERELGIAANQSKVFIGTMAGKIAREARSAGVTLILATQKLSAKMLDGIPGAGDLKTNLARMLMGNATFGEKQSALKNPMEAPDMGDVIPKGRGLWESTEANPRLIQVWFEPHQSTFAEKLAERRAPLTEAEKLDLAPYMGKASSAADEPIRRKIQPAFPMAEPEIVTVAEFEFSLDDLEILEEDEATAPEIVSTLEDTTEPSPDKPDAAPFATEHELDWDSVMPAPVPTEEPDWDAMAVESHDTDERELQLPPVPDVDDETERRTALVTSIALLGAGQRAPAGNIPVVNLPEHGSNESSLFGWWKIDAALAAAERYPALSTIVWVDPELNDEDELGIPYVDLARDVFADSGITIDARPAQRTEDTAPQTVRAPAQKKRPKPRPKRQVIAADEETFAEPEASELSRSVFDSLF